MAHCANCARSFHGSECPVCGGPAARSPKQLDQSLKKYEYVILGGLTASLLATRRYPPLDINPILLICLLLFFTPVLTHLVLAVRKRIASQFDLLRGVYKWTGVALMATSAILFVNGALDKSPSTQFHACVVRKAAAMVAEGRPTVSRSVHPGVREE